jgi:hypothetical protein
LRQRLDPWKRVAPALSGDNGAGEVTIKMSIHSTRDMLLQVVALTLFWVTEGETAVNHYPARVAQVTGEFSSRDKGCIRHQEEEGLG